VLRVRPDLLDLSGGIGRLLSGNHIMATAMVTTTAAMMVVMTRWLEPLVNSSPRAASSSSVRILLQKAHRELILLPSA
jgi:hypothetical protein